MAAGLSGGGDCSVAAAPLKERGYGLVGITLMTFDPSGPGGSDRKHVCYGPNEEEEVDAYDISFLAMPSTGPGVIPLLEEKIEKIEKRKQNGQYFCSKCQTI